MAIAPIFLFEGDTARVVLTGRQSHAVEGVVTASSHKSVTIQIPEYIKPLTFPAAAIVSCEVEIRDGTATRMAPGRLPLSLRVAVEPLKTLFLTGTGALQKDLSREALTEADRILGDRKSVV